jgi:hypothetical protein
MPLDEIRPSGIIEQAKADELNCFNVKNKGDQNENHKTRNGL